MGFEDNEISFPDALPRYVDEFADRFEADYAGPSDRYRVTAQLALGHGITVFYAHVDERDEHLLLPLGGEESDPAEVRRLENVVRDFAGPNAAAVAGAFRTHLQATYERIRTVEGSAFFLGCQYAPALGGQPTMVLQAYPNPASESLSVGYTPKHANDVEDLEACIAKNVPTATVEDYVGRLVYRIDSAIYDERVARNVVEDLDRSTLEALGFRPQTTKPLPRSLHPTYGGTDAELWQVPASTAGWVAGSNGFLRVWHLPDGTGVIDPVGLDEPHEDVAAETKARLTTPTSLPGVKSHGKP